LRVLSRPNSCFTFGGDLDKFAFLSFPKLRQQSRLPCILCNVGTKELYDDREGKVPQKKRQQLVNKFGSNPDCRVFLSTNADSTGLNLQAADTVINVDLP